MDETTLQVIGMATPATYRVTIRGKLSEHWQEWFNGSTITHEQTQDGKPFTILICKTRDQAELIGILNRLNGLNLPLLQVNLLWERESIEEGANHVPQAI